MGHLVEQELPEQVPSLLEISEKADAVAQVARDISIPMGIALAGATNRFTASLTPEGDFHVGSLSSFRQFGEDLKKVGDLQPNSSFSELGHIARRRGKENKDWYTLAAFMLHDINHLTPRNLFQLVIETDLTFRDAKRVQLHKRHYDFLNNMAAESQSLFSAMSWPIEFIGCVAKMELEQKIPTQDFKVKPLLHNIARILQSRYIFDDYELIEQGEFPMSTDRNTLYINCPDDFEVRANPALFYTVLYNLFKNAVKANAEKHYKENERAIDGIYKDKRQLIHPLHLKLEAIPGENVVFSVEDMGNGINIDHALKRFHDELSERLKQETLDQVISSEWFWNAKRILGAQQAELLFAWPNDPSALREVTVGTIFDCHFLLGFSRRSWELRSVTSGIGLWGVRYMTEKLGGMVFGTNTFDNGAKFTISIPSDKITPTKEPQLV